MKSLLVVPAFIIALGITAVDAQIEQSSDTFGSGANTFTIDFVTVGNPGNANDAGAGGGIYFSPYGGVPYVYRISTYEITQNNIEVATAAGLTNVSAGAWIGSRPAGAVTWYEAAAFVNWLNTSNGHQAAYNLAFSSGWSMTLWSESDAWQLGGENLFRHKDAYYFLPSENEWYKAAYHQNNGITADYWDYATGSNTVPTPVSSGTTGGTAVYGYQANPAYASAAGGLSPYGTMGQNGNVYEWIESAADGSNNLSLENRVIRGGSYGGSEAGLRSSNRISYNPADYGSGIGFRVASVPEPSAVLLMMMGLGALLLRRQRYHKP